MANILTVPAPRKEKCFEKMWFKEVSANSKIAPHDSNRRKIIITSMTARLSCSLEVIEK